MKPCRLTELDETRCHWPLDEPGWFCGAHVDGRQPYCTVHRRLAAKA
jgi:hypothetical protein